MKQRAHAWAALRALKILDDSKKAPKLVELLSYYLSDVWEGAWLPDTLIVHMGYGHIFKMDDNSKFIGFKAKAKRAKVPYQKLKSMLKGKRLCLEYIKNSKVLNKHYWSYEGHLPNKVIALSQTAGDMLKMADYPIAFYVKKEKPKGYTGFLTEKSIKDLSLSPNFSARHIALTFFILSHYICDCHMPLHCDLRDFNLKGKERRLPKELHSSIEDKWEGYFPSKEILILNGQTKLSVSKIVGMFPENSIIKVDIDKKYFFGKNICSIAGDEWLEMANIARVSFALAREWISRDYKDVEELIKDKGEKDFEEVTNCIFHDAVQSIAMIWCKAWNRYIK
ncbi:MAG: hypothetical protein WC549_01290 [Actinomycetota bacterium]